MARFLQNRFFILLSALTITASIVVVAIAVQHHSSTGKNLQSSGPSSESRVPPTPGIVPVRMFEVGSKESQSKQNRFTGTVRARYETPVGFRVGGKILNRLIEVGQQVTKGDLLFELDAEDYILQQRSTEAILRASTASVKQSTAEERRLADLRRSNAISQSEYDLGLSARDVAIARETSAQRQLELANNQLAYCRLLADSRGVVMNVQAESGQVVAAGFPVCVIAQMNELEAVVDIPENRSSMPIDLLAKVQFWSLPNQVLNARLRELSPVADLITRTYRARFSIQEPPSDIHLGMTASVSWGEDFNSNSGASLAVSTDFRTSIPSSAIIQHEGRSAVWLAEPEKSNPNVYRIRPRIIQVESYGDHMIEVSDGLAKGQLIVSAGVQKLDEAIRVRVWEMQK